VPVLNPPRVIPGLGRAIVNFLIESRSTWDEGSLADAFKPPGVNEDVNAPDGVKNTVSAFRAIGVLEIGADGELKVADQVAAQGSGIGRDAFRRLLLTHVFDIGRDGDSWSIGEGEAAQSGARDLARALSWFLAQDALAAPIRWTDSAQELQFQQFGTADRTKWAIINDFRWGAFSRWAPVLGLAVTSVVRAKPGLVPLPTVAIADAAAELPSTRMPIQDFLGALSKKLPVLPGGVIRNGLVARLGSDPDPGIRAEAVDTSVAQVLRALEARGRLAFERLADADGVFLSRSDQSRVTHVTVKGGKET
jgi:hypothetical protein